MMNIVIPMAGSGSRFVKAGFTVPKPLIPLHGVPMIKVAIDNLRPKCEHRFIFICQRSHVLAHQLTEKLNAWAGEALIISIDGTTEGAACSVLAATEFIDNDDPLMIANSDQYVDTSIDHYLNHMDHEQLDGLIMTMTASDPKWSFVGLDSAQLVTQVVEKQVISNEATVGIYNFRRGRDFVYAAEETIKRNLRVNGEFYVAPTYNMLIEQNKKIGIYNVGRERQGMYGLGIPEDLKYFLSLPISQTAIFA